jgi:hypothetical protein
MSKHAAESLRDYLSAYGELLPLACDEAEFWVLNVLKEVDALDYERSRPAFEGREMTPPFKSFGKQTGILSPFAFHTERLEHVDISVCRVDAVGISLKISSKKSSHLV